MFVRIINAGENKEVLVNIDHISKIEVQYAVQAGDESPQRLTYWHTSVEHGLKDSSAVRIYNVFVGGDVYCIAADSQSAVARVFDGIYKSAVKDD
jgi:hypothetical protein